MEARDKNPTPQRPAEELNQTSRTTLERQLERGRMPHKGGGEGDEQRRRRSSKRRRGSWASCRGSKRSHLSKRSPQHNPQSHSGKRRQSHIPVEAPPQTAYPPNTSLQRQSGKNHYDQRAYETCSKRRWSQGSNEEWHSAQEQFGEVDTKSLTPQCQKETRNGNAWDRSAWRKNNMQELWTVAPGRKGDDRRNGHPQILHATSGPRLHQTHPHPRFARTQDGIAQRIMR